MAKARRQRKAKCEPASHPGQHDRLTVDHLQAGSRHPLRADLPAGSRIYMVLDWQGEVAARIIDRSPYPPLEYGNASSRAIRGLSPDLGSFEPQRLVGGVFVPGPRLTSRKLAEGYLNGKP